MSGRTFNQLWLALARSHHLPPQMIGVLAATALSERIIHEVPVESLKERTHFLTRIGEEPISDSKFGAARRQAILYTSFRGRVGLVDFWDKDYPEVFRHVGRPPVFIFYRGDLDLLHSKLWGLVGTRRASAISYVACALFAQSRPAGEGIISGLALGVDAAAHWAALSAGRPNVAVLGCGIDRIYPWANKTLFQQMYAQPQRNLIISEFPLGTTPDQRRFPRRNRLISAGACGVIVWESPRKSGAVNTAHHAREFGHEPFVFIHRNQWSNQGGHKMIHKGEAHPLYPVLWQPGRFIRPGRFHRQGVRLGLFLRSLGSIPMANRGVSLSHKKKILYLGGDSYLWAADNRKNVLPIPNSESGP